MAKNKYSEALQDAYMTGDMKKVSELKELIEKDSADRYKANFSKEAKRRSESNVIKVNTILNDDNSSARSIYDFLNNNIGTDWWEDEIETTYRLLWTDYGIALSDVNRDKVLALRHICRNDAAFFDWFEFNQVALSLGGAIADFESLKKPSPGMVINAIHTLNIVRPDKEKYFEDEVLKYICITLINDGIYTPPPSIADVIGVTMNELTSEVSVDSWAEVGKKYDEAKAGIIDETMTGIQAKRLVVAESAARQYLK